MSVIRAVASSFACLATAVAATCPPADFDTIESFDLAEFASSRWYIQQQMETKYLPKTKNFCVYAEYHRRKKKTTLGYDIDVHNRAEGKDGEIFDSGNLLQAKIVDEARGKLEVAPWFLPPILAGPYWVIAYDEKEGYALVSGGPPTIEGKDGKCQTGKGVNDAGLWIFTREQKRDDALLEKVRGLAEAKGFDLSVLDDVDQTNCAQGTSAHDTVVV